MDLQNSQNTNPEIISQLRNLTLGFSNLYNLFKTVFPISGGTSVSATGGAATLPANPVGFLTVTLPNGTAAKIPYYS